MGEQGGERKGGFGEFGEISNLKNLANSETHFVKQIDEFRPASAPLVRENRRNLTSKGTWKFHEIFLDQSVELETCSGVT